MPYRKIALEIKGPKFILRIKSYGHINGPLRSDDHETARLSYSVRDVPHPPAPLRRSSTGLSARLRREVIQSKEGQTRLEQITEAVEDKMTEMEEELSRAPSPEPTVDILKPKEAQVLVVAIMCEEGRHRSVAFAEELAESIHKRKEWDVKVEHRDLGADEAALDGEDESEEEVTSPTDPKMKKQIDKQRKKMRSASMRLADGIED